MTQPAPTSHRRLAWTLAGVCLLGALLRFWALDYGLPGVYNPDEIPILNRALAFAKGDPNPHNFLYPSLHFYALFAWEALFFAVGYTTGLFSSLQAFQQQFFLDPSHHILAGRALTAVIGTVTLVAVYRFGRRLYGPSVGIAAALFLAVSPFAVRDAHYIKLDVPVALMTLLAHVALARLVVDQAAAARRRNWIIAGVLGGLAVSTQYYVAPVIVAFILVALADVRRSGDWRVSLGLLTASGVAFIAGFLLGTPFIVTEPAIALRDMAGVREVNFDRALATGGPLTSIWPYLVMLATDAMGWPVFAFAVVGAALALRADWRRGLLLVAFPLSYLAFISHTVPMSRYLDCVLPVVVVAAGYGVMAVLGMVQARATRYAPAAAVAVIGLAALPGLLLSIRSNQFFAQDDTRTLAQGFIEREVPAESTVLIQPYSAPVRMSRDALVSALRHHLGDESLASIKFQLQLALDPYPQPAYWLVYLGDGGEDVDKVYISPRVFGAGAGLDLLRERGIQYIVLKETNIPNPATAALEAALGREGQLLATFSPYRDAATVEARARTSPYFHNTATRILPALERPGPIVHVWRLP